MKKLISFLFCIMTMMVICGCKDKGKQTNTEGLKIAEQQDDADTTLYGKCGDGTSMNVLELVTDKGDTLSLMLEGVDASADVQGGLLSGDRLAVLAYKGSDNEMYAQKVINITTLMGKWTSIDRSFDIQEGGIVAGDNMEPKPYVDWKIFNGKLVLTADTFSVYSLGPDSLLLENANGIYAYKRVEK